MKPTISRATAVMTTFLGLGKAHIQAGRANVRQSFYMPALVAARFNPDIEAKYTDLISIGKPQRSPSLPS